MLTQLSVIRSVLVLYICKEKYVLGSNSIFFPVWTPHIILLLARSLNCKIVFNTLFRQKHTTERSSPSLK